MIIHHQQENTIIQDGEVMISLGFTLLLLFKMEMENYSISSTIAKLQQITATTQEQEEI